MSDVKTPKTITFTAEDGITITADLYKTANKNDPYIILFHQARYSRGEYIEIAPRLNAIGFNCLATDQRSGTEVNGVINKTAAEAEKRGLKPVHPDAWQDLKAALLYAKNELKAEKIIIWGSSYSASLALVLGSEFPRDISGILAFSPGEYFEFNGKKIGDYADNIKCPVFITAEERVKDEAKVMYDRVPCDNKEYCRVDIHGSSVLFGAYVTPVWDKVSKFLDSL